MFFAALDRLRTGSLVCVFDATDRIQHMFWRDIDAGHPAGRGRDAAPHRDAIRELYAHNDALVGRVRAQLRDGDVLMVISDHGFTSFRRGVNLNSGCCARATWCSSPAPTAAASGCATSTGRGRAPTRWGSPGLFLNLRGTRGAGHRRPRAPTPTRSKAELIDKLRRPVRRREAASGINEAFDTAAIYAGPYIENAPDLVIGYNAGYRNSWDCAKGVVAGPVFEDNIKAVERRSLRRSAARPWRVLLQPRRSKRRSRR